MALLDVSESSGDVYQSGRTAKSDFETEDSGRILFLVRDMTEASFPQASMDRVAVTLLKPFGRGYRAS